MHYLVKMIVKADDAEEALAQAERDADELIERGTFDWYAMDGRWGNAEALTVGSDEGKALIKEGMESDRADFDRGLEAIRYMLNNFSDDEIYNERFGDQKNSEFYLSRYQFNVVSGDTNSPCVYAVDGNLWGGKVHNDRDLENLHQQPKGHRCPLVHFLNLYHCELYPPHRLPSTA